MQRYEIDGVGLMDFPDEMSEEDIAATIETEILPSADLENPDPEMVALRPDLFPDINRGSLFGGIGSGAERLSRVPENIGAAVGRDEEDLFSLKDQMAADDQDHIYRANLDDAVGQFQRGDYTGSASTFFLDIIPQTLGESLPDLGIMASGAFAGAKAGAVFGAPGAAIGAAVGGILAGTPSFVGQHVERQVREGNITDPEDIDTASAVGTGVVSAALEYAIFPILARTPGIRALKPETISAMLKRGANLLSTKEGAKILGKASLIGGATETVTETGQQVLERAQAGLTIDPEDEQALGEYIESAVLGGALGMIFGAGAGTFGVARTRKAGHAFNEMAEEQRIELEAAAAEAERRRAVGLGIIPNQEILSLTARPELMPDTDLMPVEDGDRDLNMSEAVEGGVNRTEAQFKRDADQRLIDEAMDPKNENQTPEQANAASLFKAARESLHGMRFTPAELETAGASNIAQAVADMEAGQGNLTVEQDGFTIEELEEQGRVRGVDPEVLSGELQALRQLRRPETERVNNVTEPEIIELAKEKNVLTGTKSFDALVKYVTGADRLSKASPFRLALMRDTLRRVAPFETLDNLLDVREENYTHEDFNRAVQIVLNNKQGKGKTPKFNRAELKRNFPDLNMKDIAQIREEMIRIGLVRQSDGRVTHELMRPEFIPPTTPVKGPTPIIEEGREVDYEVRGSDGKHVVVAKERTPDPTKTGKIQETHIPFEEVISIHDDADGAELAAHKYRNGLSSVNPDGTYAKREDDAGLTDVDLRSTTPTEKEVRQYKAWKDRTGRAGVRLTSQQVKNITEALNNNKTQQLLAAVGINAEVVQDLSRFLTQEEKDADVRSPEGAWDSNNEVILLAIDTAIDGLGNSITEEALEQAAMENLARVLSHEQIHALREKKIISEDDFRVLKRYVEKTRRPPELSAHLGWTPGVLPNMTYLEEARIVYAGEVAKNVTRLKARGKSRAEIKRYNEDFLREEAVAEAFRDWAKDKTLINGRPESIFRKIIRFIMTLGGLLYDNGVRSAEDIFNLIEEGTLDGGPATTAGPPDIETGPKFSIAGPAIKYDGKVYSVKNPIANHNQIDIPGVESVFEAEKSGRPFIEGFITDRGKFIRRDDAFDEAAVSGQLTKEGQTARRYMQHPDLITPYIRFNDESDASYSIAPNFDALGFSSQAYEAVRNFGEESGTGKMWKQHLAKNAKPAELDTIVGLEEMLAGVEGRISKKDMLDFINQRGLKLDEVVLGTKKFELPDGMKIIPFGSLNVEQFDKVSDLGGFRDDPRTGLVIEEFYVFQGGRYVTSYPTRANAEQDLHQVLAGSGGTKFRHYTLPGGRSHREFYITLPSPTTSDEFASFNTTIKDWLVPPSHRIEDAEADNRLVLRVRVSDRIIDGKSVLFIEELQGDRQQAAKVKGGFQLEKTFNDLSPADQTIYNRMQELEKIGARTNQQERDEYVALAEAAGVTPARGSIAMLEGESRIPPIPWEKDSEWGRLGMKRVIMKAVEEGYDSVAWTPGATQISRYEGSGHVINDVLLMNMSSSFSAEDVKIITKKVRDEGPTTYTLSVEGVAGLEEPIRAHLLTDGTWITAHTRKSLTLGSDVLELGRVSSIEDVEAIIRHMLNEEPEFSGDHYAVVITDEVGVDVSLPNGGHYATENEIRAFLGGKVANELFSEENRKKLDNKEHVELNNADTTVGGKGLVQFYDDILTSIANKIGKRFGAKVKRGRLERRGGGKFDAIPDAVRMKREMWRLPIPKKMSDTVKKEGFAKFSIAPPINTRGWKDWWKDSKAVDGDGNPMEMYRGLRRYPHAAGRPVQKGIRSTESYTSSTDVANIYASSQTGEHEYAFTTGSNIRKAYLSVQNPLDWANASGAAINLETVASQLKLYNEYGHIDLDGAKAIGEILDELSTRENMGVIEGNFTAGTTYGLTAIDTAEAAQETFDELEINLKEAHRVYDEDPSVANGKNVDTASREITDFMMAVEIDAYILADLEQVTDLAKAAGYDGIKHNDVINAGLRRGQALLGKSPEELEGVERSGNDRINVTWRPFHDFQSKSPFIDTFESGELEESGEAKFSIRGPAIKYKGQVYSSSDVNASHYEIELPEGVDVWDAEITDPSYKEGFMTSKGRFVTREQAFEEARVSGQLNAHGINASKAYTPALITPYIHTEFSGGKFSLSAPTMMRYAVDVRRPGKKTITRQFMAPSLTEAQKIAYGSTALNRGASELVNIRLDDPAFDEGGHKKSIRGWRRKWDAGNDQEKYLDATSFIRMSSREDDTEIPGVENAIGRIYVGPDPYSLVLMKGHADEFGNGFGLDHIVDKLERFDGGAEEFRDKLTQMIDAMGQKKVRLFPYRPQNRETSNKLDWTVLWKDYDGGGTLYRMGVELWTSDKDRVTYAAITTFFPVDAKAEERERASQAKRESSRRRKEATQDRKKGAARRSIAPAIVPEGEVAIRAVSREKSGIYKGAPIASGMTPREVTKLVNKLTKQALSEVAVYEESQYWYENAGMVIRTLSSGNQKVMEDMLRIVAYLSADNSLGSNIAAAIDTAYDIAVNGNMTVGRGRYINVALERLPLAIAAEKFDSRLDGVSDKVMSFYRNMRDPAYGTNDFAGESTLDKWMHRAFGFKVTGDEKFTPTQYAFGRMVMQRVANKLSKKLGRTVLPRQAQAMIWTAERNKDVEPANATMVGFEHYFDRHDAVITWEANPSVVTDLFPEIASQPMHVQKEFAKQAYELITSGGQDILLHKIGGAPLYASMPGTGGYAGDVSPNITTHVMLPRSADKSYDTTAADLYAAVIGYIYNQNAVAWHRADPTLKASVSNVGVRAVVESGSVDPTELYRFVRTHMASSDFSLVPTLDGKMEFRFINFNSKTKDNPDGMPDRSYVAALEKALKRFPGNVTFRIKDFKSTGGYIENNWQEDKNGEGYKRRISEAGRPDLLNWADGRRQAFHKLVKDWQAKIDPKAALSRDGGRDVNQGDVQEIQLPPIEPDGTVRLTHWSESEKIKNVLPKRHGTGVPGEESRRKRTYPKEWVDRSYYGVGVGKPGGYKKELKLGSETYVGYVPFEKLYDINGDDGVSPGSIKAKAAAKWGNDVGGRITEVEKLAKAAGYHGYWGHHPNGIVAAMFRPLKVEKTEPEGKFSIAPPIDSAAFWSWFSESEVMNEDGTPLLLYHGTPKDFDEFDTDIIFFSESPAVAEFFADLHMENRENTEDAQRIIPAYLSVQKLWDFRKEEHIDLIREWANDQEELVGQEGYAKLLIRDASRGDWDTIEDPDFLDFIRERGFDGFTVIEINSNFADTLEADDPRRSFLAVNYGVFSPSQVKSPFNEDFDVNDLKHSIAPPRNRTAPPPSAPAAPPAPPTQPATVDEDAFIRSFTEADRTIWKRMKNAIKRQLAPGGVLPRIAFDLKLFRDSKLRVVDDITARTLRTMEVAMKRVFRRPYEKLTDEELIAINSALRGDSLGDLPVPIKEAVAKMRLDIDAMSDEFIAIMEADIAELEAQNNPDAAARAQLLRDVVVGNKGEYLTRSYKMFDDPTWFSKIPEGVLRTAHRYLVTQNGGDVEAASRVLSTLVKGDRTAYIGVSALIKESTLGAKDLTILMKRKNIAPEIRAVMGEYTDPMHNYARTMLKMSRLIYNTNFLNSLKEAGLGEFMWEENERPAEATVQMAGTNSKVLEPLNNLWTTPEVKAAFKDILGKYNLPNWIGNLVGLNGVVKAGKIVYSPPTQIRNVLSATFFGIMGGGVKVKEIIPAAAMIWDQINAREGNRAAAYRHYVDVGLLQDNPNAGLVQDLMQDGSSLLSALEWKMESVLGEKTAATITGKAKKFNKIVTNFYRGGDDVWKIIIFESQLADYMNATGMAREEAEPIVAKRVRDTVPTYSLVGPGMKRLGRFPLLGPFVAFSSEVIRTNKNNLKLIASDLKDPRLKRLAYKRIIGTIVAHAWAKALMTLSLTAFGISDDEEESVRRLGVGPWSKNADLLFLGRDKNGQLETVDLSFVDPYNIFHKPLTAILRNQPWETGFAEAVAETFMPFVQPDIAASAIYEAVSNQKIRSGAPIYNSEAPGSEQAAAIAEHLFFQMGPGVLLPTRKIVKALKGDRDPTGRTYDMNNEVMGMFGLRIKTFDPKYSLYFRVGDFTEALGKANSYLYNVAADIDPVSSGDLEEAFSQANKIRLRAYDDMAEIISAAKSTGLSYNDIKRVLQVSGVSKKYANALARGKEAPKWKIGKTFLKGATKRAKLLIDRETATELRKRRRAVKSFARTSQRQTLQ